MSGEQTMVEAALSVSFAGKAITDAIVGLAMSMAEIQGTKTQTQSYVVHGAMVACYIESEQGEEKAMVCNGRESRLTLPISHGVFLRRKAQLNKGDCVPNVNLHSCGVCLAGLAEEVPDEVPEDESWWDSVCRTAKSVKELFFRSKEAQEEREKELEELIVVCTPVVDIEQGWLEPKDDVYIEGKKALLNTSYIPCKKGGTIYIVDDGQMSE